MSNERNDQYYDDDSRTDKSILGSFRILFVLILIAFLVYLQLEHEILVFVWNYFALLKI